MTLAANNTLLRWDMAAGDPGRAAVFLSQDIGALDTALITSNSRWFAAVTSNGARLWDLTALDPTEASGALLDVHGGSAGHIPQISPPAVMVAGWRSRLVVVRSCAILVRRSRGPSQSNSLAEARM